MTDEWDDNPEWTAEDFARAVPTRVLLGDVVADALLRKPGRPKLAENAAKQAISLRLAPDVLAAMRATGRGWQTRAEAVLRKEFVA